MSTVNWYDAAKSGLKTWFITGHVIPPLNDEEEEEEEDL